MNLVIITHIDSDKSDKNTFKYETIILSCFYQNRQNENNFDFSFCTWYYYNTLMKIIKLYILGILGIELL